MSNLKILVCGDVKGKIKRLFTRIERILKKSGPFDFLLCVGEFFGTDDTEWQMCFDGSLETPLPIYILGSSSNSLSRYYPTLNGCEICDNVIYLGKSGIFTGSTGLKIAYLSGHELSGKSNEESHGFSHSDAKKLLESATSTSNFQGVDIFITSQWPKGIEKYASEIDGVNSKECGSELISMLAKELKPRYHFAGQEGQCYERQPYRNHQVLAEEAQHVTRFIALADVDNTLKRKWIYAFSMAPISTIDKSELKTQPDYVTENPFKDIRVNFQSNLSTNSQQFFYNMDSNPSNGNKKRKHGNDFNAKHPKKQPLPLRPCWFCLSGPDVKKHLVVSVGEECYIALAQGGIFPDHVLILPIGHCRSTLELPPEAVDEVERYKKSIQKYFQSKGSHAVFYERNYKSPHLQIQCIPMPKSCSADLIKETFQNIGDSMNVEMDEVPRNSNLMQIVDVGRPYFYVEISNGCKLMHRVKKGMPVNFGREVLCSSPMLNMEDKIDWRECQNSLEEETKMAEDFREGFAPFDFSL